MNLRPSLLVMVALAGMLSFQIGSPLKAQIPFGEFEDWEETDTLFRNPLQWSSLNEIHYLLGYDDFTVTRTESTIQGAYALQVQTKRFCNADSSVCSLVPGMAVLGDLYVHPFDLSIITPGLPFDGRPEYVTAYFKYYPVESDTFLVVAELSRSMSGGGKEIVAYGEYRFERELPQFNTMNLQLDYYSDANPDKIRLVIYSGVKDISYFDGYPTGSKLIIDNVQLGPELVSTGIGDQAGGLVDLRVFPIPVQENLFMEWTGTTSGDYLVSLFDNFGRVVSTSTVLGNGGNVKVQHQLDVASLVNGNYWIRVTDAAGMVLATRQVPVIR